MRTSHGSPTGRWRPRLAAVLAAGMVAGIGPAMPAASGTAPDAAAVSSTASIAAVPLAFPGAQGAGANSKGGRGGDVYYVTTLADSGPGSLREGINTAPTTGRTILFKLSGTINLASGLSINRSNITIAGQTAPGDGIAIRGHTIYLGVPPPRQPGSSLANDIIIRHIRTRLGVGTQGTDQTDGIWINSGSNIILDHVSSSWSADETLSASRDVRNLTVQNTFMTEALNAAGHGFGSIIASGYPTVYSWHHNLWAHNDSRNPRPGSDPPDPTWRLDLRNNVLYNWGRRIGYSGSGERVELNYVNNYLVAGPSSSSTCAMDSGGSLRIHQSGNKIDLNKNGRVDGADTGWSMFCGSYSRQDTAFEVPPVTTDSADSAYLKVLAQGGATPWRRDPVDRRIANTVRTQTGRIINSPDDVGGYPTLVSEPAPVDADSDGMPDFWEQALGLNPNNAADRNNTDPAGYTMLENYLNWLADPHAATDRNTPIDIDLRTLNGGLDNLQFTVAAGGNGTITLLADGHTARFTPTTDHVGPAHFTYTLTDTTTGFGFGPVSVGVLVKGTGGGTPTAPAITTQPQNQTVTAGSNVTFTVAASGTPPLSYQWRHNGTAIPGANAASYTITNVQSTHAGQYTVGVSNTAGSVTSDPATLTVQPPGGTTRYEAEAGTIGGGSRIDSEHAPFTGTGYVNFPTTGGSLQWTNVNGGAGGNATLTIRYANGSGTARTGRLLINGTPQPITTPNTTTWNNWQTLTLTIPLTAGGANTIRFETTGQDLANIDHIIITN